MRDWDSVGRGADNAKGVFGCFSMIIGVLLLLALAPLDLLIAVGIIVGVLFLFGCVKAVADEGDDSV